MSVAVGRQGERAACRACLRRSWLLGELTAPLDYNCREDGRLMELLALADAELLQLAVGGRRRTELQARSDRFHEAHLQRTDGVAEICRHDRRYPPALQVAGVPPMLHISGELERLRDLVEQPVVALLGSSCATDYGIEMGASLARGLAASGVTVATGLGDAVAAAAQRGVLEARGKSLAVIAGGLDIAAPARRRGLLERLSASGCALSELPCGVRPRRWGAAASLRTLAAIADVTVVVESTNTPRELVGARLAQGFDKTVAAVPGRITSRASGGPHALLREGVRLICEAGDVLELLSEADRPAPGLRVADSPDLELEPRLRTMLERVGAGADTPGKLDGGKSGLGETLRALSELELLGLLARGDGGRYVLRHSLSR